MISINEKKHVNFRLEPEDSDYTYMYTYTFGKEQKMAATFECNYVFDSIYDINNLIH